MISCRHPLGLPKGSIRAILAIGICFLSIYGMLTGKITVDDYILIVGIILAFYFGTKREK